MILTKKLFLGRFTDTEMATILQASDAVPAVRVHLFKLSEALDIDTTDFDTIKGLQALEAAGLLAEGRAAKILNLGYANPLPPFDAIGSNFEIVEIRADGTAILQVENERIGFSAGNYEVVA